MQLVDDLLDISRIVSGKLPIVAEAIELWSVLAAAIETVRPNAAAKDVALVMTPHTPSLPAFGDAARLRQIMWNLLSNALKFTPAGGRIEVALTSVPGEAIVVVEDTGEGIAAELIPYIFERFRQGDASVTRRHGGLGLGLAIARHLAEAHGGSLTGASDGPGRGARFTLRLPLPAVPGLALPAVDNPPPLAG
jgi:signal transduction histidine kinase